MKNQIKRMLFLWLILTILMHPIQLFGLNKSLTLKELYLATAIYVLLFFLQIGAYIKAKALAKSNPKSCLLIILIVFCTSCGTILYSNCSGGILPLLMPVIYTQIGLFKGPQRINRKQVITLFLAVTTVFLSRQTLEMVVDHEISGNWIINAGFFFMTMYQLITTYAQLQVEKEELASDIQVVRDSSEKDPMTGLYNRSTMEEEMSRLASKVSTFGVIMFDIDNFKKVNDTYGHTFGDTVLKKLASIMLEETKKTDMAFRYGGEEFLILLPKTELSGAVACGERIRKQFEVAEFDLNGEKLHFTVSVGVTSCRYGQYTSNKDLIEYCDKALYRAKRNGKNQVQSL